MQLEAHARRTGDRLASRRQRATWARRSAALAMAALAQGGLLWLTTIQQRAVPFAAVETRGLPVSILRPRALATPRRAKQAQPAPAAAGAIRQPAAGPPAPPAPEIAASPTPGAAAPGPAAPGPAAPGLPGDVAAVLRGSAVGCANASAVGLSAAERAGCRNRLAAGAAAAPNWSGIPGAKRTYYDAVLAAEADYRKTGGHPPMLVCHAGGSARLPHALKIGPCYIDPPQGSLSVDVDVPEVESQHNAPPPPR